MPKGGRGSVRAVFVGSRFVNRGSHGGSPSQFVNRNRMLIVDAHLDLAYNALRGREVTKPAAQQTASLGDGTPSVGLPDLRQGGVDLICATIFCEPAKGADATGYRTAGQAHAQAQRQLRWYYKQASDGLLQLVTEPYHLPSAAAGAARPGVQKAILLM